MLFQQLNCPNSNLLLKHQNSMLALKYLLKDYGNPKIHIEMRSRICLISLFDLRNWTPLLVKFVSRIANQHNSLVTWPDFISAATSRSWERVAVTEMPKVGKRTDDCEFSTHRRIPWALCLGGVAWIFHTVLLIC